MTDLNPVDRTAQYLREKALDAYVDYKKAAAVKDSAEIAIHFEVYYALMEAYAFHTSQPVGMVHDVLKHEGLARFENKEVVR